MTNRAGRWWHLWSAIREWWRPLHAHDIKGQKLVFAEDGGAASTCSQCGRFMVMSPLGNWQCMTR